MSYDEDMLLENDLNPKKKSKHERIIDQLKDIEEFDYNDAHRRVQCNEILTAIKLK